MKDSKWARGTHILEIVEEGIIKTWKKNWASKGHSHSREWQRDSQDTEQM
jgi:hypothetical protein